MGTGDATDRETRLRGRRGPAQVTQREGEGDRTEGVAIVRPQGQAAAGTCPAASGLDWEVQGQDCGAGQRRGAGPCSLARLVPAQTPAARGTSHPPVRRVVKPLGHLGPDMARTRGRRGHSRVMAPHRPGRHLRAGRRGHRPGSGWCWPCLPGALSRSPHRASVGAEELGAQPWVPARRLTPSTSTHGETGGEEGGREGARAPRDAAREE